jgi:hypothetical protein
MCKNLGSDPQYRGEKRRIDHFMASNRVLAEKQTNKDF